MDSRLKRSKFGRGRFCGSQYSLRRLGMGAFYVRWWVVVYSSVILFFLHIMMISGFVFDVYFVIFFLCLPNWMIFGNRVNSSAKYEAFCLYRFIPFKRLTSLVFNSVKVSSLKGKVWCWQKRLLMPVRSINAKILDF